MLRINPKNQIITAAIIFAALLSLSSCSSNTKLYSWHKYEDAAYKNSKLQTEKSNKTFVKEINKVINKQHESRKTVPPGILAEYGFYLIKNENTGEGKELLQKEVETYPESNLFISRIIKQLENNTNETN